MKISDLEVGIKYLIFKGNNSNIIRRDHILLKEDGRLLILDSWEWIKKEDVEDSIKDIEAIAKYKLDGLK